LLYKNLVFNKQPSQIDYALRYGCLHLFILCNQTKILLTSTESVAWTHTHADML